MLYYLNKKRRQLIGMLFVSVKGAVPPEGFLLREFDYDKTNNKFVFKRERMLPTGEGESRLKSIRGNPEWAPLPPNSIEKFIDYSKPPLGGSNAIQERKTEKVHVGKAPGNRPKVGR